MTASVDKKCRFRIAGLLLFVAASSVCFGQVNLPVVTGLCHGHETDPGCVLPNLFGPTGLTLDPYNTSPPHYAHFLGSVQQTLNQGLGTAIATQLAVLPIVSPSSGFTYRYDSAAGAFVRTTTSFGPVYTERAETIGKYKVSFGVSYQRYRFSNLDGIDLRHIPAVFSHVSGTGPEGTMAPYEVDLIQTYNSIGLNIDQTMLYGTVGITDRIDVSVAVPIVSVRMGASSSARIIYVAAPPKFQGGADPHQFPGCVSVFTDCVYGAYSSTGSSSGIGDVTFRIKGSVLQTPSLRMALALDVRAPSGDARQFLGAGATGIKPFVAISKPGKFSPHVNLGYQWNGSSILAGNITGSSFQGVDPANGMPIIQNGPATTHRLPSQFLYSLGADVGVTSRITFAFDYLGQTLFDAPRTFTTNFTSVDHASQSGMTQLSTISGSKDTVGLNSGSTGVKVNLFGNLLLTGNILFRLDSKGLRQDVTPLVALSYAFPH